MITQKILYSFAIGLSLLLYSVGAQTNDHRPGADSSEKFKTEQEIIRVQMVQLSRELGVTCTECHSSKNWKDGSKANFKIAKEHMKTVQILRSNGFNGKTGPEASCFMCHQGKMKFAFKMQHPEGAAAPADSTKTE